MYPFSVPRPIRKVALFAAILLALLATVVSTASATSTPPAPAANPDFQSACGTKVVVVLDESQSIGNAAGAVQAVRDAANAFASGLADTGSQLAVIEFGGTAKRVFDYTSVTSGAGGTLATTFRPYFDGTATPPADVYHIPTQLGHLTNWEAALKEVALLNGQSSVAPLVVFITDGDPTTIGGGSPSTIPSATAVGPAIVQANAVKAQGSHILAVGVGAALNNAASLGRLNAVSGPDTVTDPASLDVATTDVLAVSSFANLPAALRALVNQLCASPTVPVTVPLIPVAPTPPPVITISGVSQTTLRIDKRGPAIAKAGQVITYRIKISNTGTIVAENVIMRDRLPNGIALAAKPAGIQLVNGVITVSVGDLGPGASKTLVFKARIDRTATGARTNVATASASNASQVRDLARTKIVTIAGQIRIPVVTG